jgi:hypothetical protein
MPSNLSQTDHLEDSDLDRHKEMVAHIYESRELARLAQELQSAVNVWARDLARKYELGPLDRVLEDGTIVRESASEHSE